MLSQLVILALCLVPACLGYSYGGVAVAASDGQMRGSCDLRPRTVDACAARAIAFCGEGGTSAFFVCRDVFNKFCTAPAPETSVERCLIKRCDTLAAAPGHTVADTIAACRTGRFGKTDMADLCAEQTCPPPAQDDRRATCDLRPRTAASCEARAEAFCGTGGTAVFFVCRDVYNKFCNAPQPVASVEACLASRCDTLQAPDAAHTLAATLSACRTGRFGLSYMQDLCAEQTCPHGCTGITTGATCPLPQVALIAQSPANCTSQTCGTQPGCQCNAPGACTRGTTRLAVVTRDIDGCSCQQCQPCPAPAPIICPQGQTVVQVPDQDGCPISKCETCTPLPSTCPVGQAITAFPNTLDGCPVKSCCPTSCPTLQCHQGQFPQRQANGCCPVCTACPTTLESCPPIKCTATQTVIFPPNTCCPVCVSPTANNNLGVTANNLRDAQIQSNLPIIIGATVGGACVVAGVITTVVLVQRYKQAQLMTALHQPLADI